MSEHLAETGGRRRDPFFTGQPIGLCAFSVVLGYALALGWQVLRQPLSYASGGKNRPDLPAFFGSLAGRASSLTKTPELSVHLVSVFAVLRSLGVIASASWAAQLAIAAVITAVICRLWARPTPYALRAAAAAVGASLSSPHMFGYDACILTIGAAFLVNDGLARGFLRGEREIMLGCWGGLLLMAGPIVTLVSITLFILVVRRALQLAGNVVVLHPAVEGTRP